MPSIILRGGRISCLVTAEISCHSFLNLLMVDPRIGRDLLERCREKKVFMVESGQEVEGQEDTGSSWGPKETSQWSLSEASWPHLLHHKLGAKPPAHALMGISATDRKT